MGNNITIKMSPKLGWLSLSQHKIEYVQTCDQTHWNEITILTQCSRNRVNILKNRTYAGEWLSLTWSVTLTHWQGQMSFYKHVTKDSCKHPQDTKRVIDRDRCHQIKKIYLNTDKTEKKWPKVRSWENVFLKNFLLIF